MDLDFSDDERALQDHVVGAMARCTPPAVARSVYEGEPSAADRVWQHMVDAGWPAFAVAADQGGMGLGFVETAIVADAVGAAVAPGSYLATATQFLPMVAEVGTTAQSARWATAVAAEGCTGTVALAEGGRWQLAAVAATATPVEGGWRLRGRKDAVVDGESAEEIAIVARAPGTQGSAGIGVFVVPSADCVLIPRCTIDPTTRLCDLVLDDVVVDGERSLGSGLDGTAARAVERALEQATVALAASLVGTCRRIFELTLEHAKQRQQFGRPIGSFQALKHRLADLYLTLERATALVWFAAATIAEDDPRRSEAVSLAKAGAGDCQRFVVQDGLQLHGGIGYTWAHDLHLFLKRAKAIEPLFGSAASHRAALARRLGLTDIAS